MIENTITSRLQSSNSRANSLLTISFLVESSYALALDIIYFSAEEIDLTMLICITNISRIAKSYKNLQYKVKIVARFLIE